MNFKTADLALHEAVARRLAIESPAIVLSTCNRIEIYFSTPVDLLAFPLQNTYFHSGAECFFHLCKVASGLDSAVFAETDILRQVKAAYTRACQQYILPSALHYLFQKSFKIAKAVRSEFFAKKTFPTIESVLWQMISEILPQEHRKTLLVGYSEMHRKFAAFLTRKGVRDISFCTRSSRPEVQVNMHGREELQHWQHYDLISCATQADDFLITGQGRKKHLIFDLSVPRCVDPNIGGVSLFNIEQINWRIDHAEQNLEEIESFIWENVLRLIRIRQRIDGALHESLYN